LEPQVLELFWGQLEHEIFRETLTIPLHGSVQDLRFDGVELRQVGVQHDLMASDQ
jgi:hypothetical protein